MKTWDLPIGKGFQVHADEGEGWPEVLRSAADQLEARSEFGCIVAIAPTVSQEESLPMLAVFWE